MIAIETDRIYVISCRTNRRVKWAYSDYCGRYSTKEEAIDKAKDIYGDTPFEYNIENWDTDEVETGFINWGKRR